MSLNYSIIKYKLFIHSCQLSVYVETCKDGSKKIPRRNQTYRVKAHNYIKRQTFEIYITNEQYTDIKKWMICVPDRLAYSASLVTSVVLVMVKICMRSQTRAESMLPKNITSV